MSKLTFLFFFVHLSLADRLFATSNGLVVNARLDPLLSPGTCSAHVHSVFGSYGFGSTVKYLQSPTIPTSSNVFENKSQYWAPSLYVKWNNRFYIVPSWARIYYFVTNNRALTKPYPVGMRAIISIANGDQIKWTAAAINRDQTNFVDHNQWTYFGGTFSHPQLEMSLEFPSCLKVNSQGQPILTSPDFRSHLSYTENKSVNGACPSTHPYRVPQVTVEVRYNIEKMIEDGPVPSAVVRNQQNWYLSNGDRTGITAHADFIAAWPTDLMTRIISNCDDSGKNFQGRVCPVSSSFTPSQASLDRSAQLHVTPLSDIPEKMPNEAVTAVSSLPSGSCVLSLALQADTLSENLTTIPSENAITRKSGENAETTVDSNDKLVSWQVALVTLASVAVTLLLVLVFVMFKKA